MEFPGPDLVAVRVMAVLGVVLLLAEVNILIHVHNHRQYLTGAHQFQVLWIWVPVIKIFWQLYWDLGHPLAQHTENSLL